MSESCSVMRDPKEYTVYVIFQGRILEWVAIPLPKLFLNQGSNPGVLHCRQILYQLSHQGSPAIKKTLSKRSCLRILKTE